MLDTHPLNILGKGILDPETEADMIARGIVFAALRTAYPPSGKPFPFLITSKRPYADILNACTPIRSKRAARTPVRA